jgi:hypothetical protein
MSDDDASPPPSPQQREDEQPPKEIDVDPKKAPLTKEELKKMEIQDLFDMMDPQQRDIIMEIRRRTNFSTRLDSPETIAARTHFHSKWAIKNEIEQLQKQLRLLESEDVSSQKTAATMGGTSTSFIAAISPRNHFKKVSESANKRTLNDLTLVELRSEGVVPQWNGKIETFWLFRMNVMLKRDNAVWSPATMFKHETTTVDIIANPFKVHKQHFIVGSPFYRDYAGPIHESVELRKNLRLFTMFLLNSVEPKFMNQIMGHQGPQFELDGRVLWISMCLEVFGNRLTYTEGWMDHVKNASPPKYNYNFSRYKQDIESHLQLMTAANIDVQPLARHIITQLASWNVAPFTQAINSISYQALSSGWDCLKILSEAKKFQDHFLSLNQWTPVESEFATLLAHAKAPGLLSKAATQFLPRKSATITRLETFKPRNTRDKKWAIWQITAPDDFNKPLVRSDREWWWCAKCTPPRYGSHRTYEHINNFVDPRKKRPRQDAKQSAFHAADLTQESINNAVLAFATSLTQQRDEYQASLAAASVKSGEESDSEEEEIPQRRRF